MFYMREFHLSSMLYRFNNRIPLKFDGVMNFLKCLLPNFGMREARIRSNISNTSDSVSSGYPNTEKRVENTTRSGVFLTTFEVFG